MVLISQNSTDLHRDHYRYSDDIRKANLVPDDGEVYIFVNKSRQVMKILHWERGGYNIDYKRMKQGRFHSRFFRKQGIRFRRILWDEIV